MGWWNSAGLIESERQFSAHGLRASGAQWLCGKDMFCVLQGGEPKGGVQEFLLHQLLPEELNSGVCWGSHTVGSGEKQNTGDASPC